MSFSRYYTVGYGFEVDIIGAINALTSYRYEHLDEEADSQLAYEMDDLESLLAEKFPRLKIIFAGDHSGGDQKDWKQWVVVDNTFVQLWDEWSKTFDISYLKTGSQDPEALQQLFDFSAYTGAAVGSLQWILARSESY